ncbi:DUF2069 domain-containing protein [Vulcaniibacterium tengchongense]|uniref:Putative membrane protein n=1 Tax=Vulcaniibacterium tengchongense TaxID=1273429 RepID=A0A3N4V762_9GAMM|nr:DUF2069 domain-containing protein [Vulcaniibacterium tengchongense]RPE75529.1 putative membrane protein [Vulcaniibacterium tengchongense]
MIWRAVLLLALLALAAVYVVWFVEHEPSPAVELVVFALPPLLLALGVWRHRRRAGFWAGVLALAWFSHAVMVAYTRPPERGYALIALALAVAIVFAASLPGLRARFGRRRG